MSRFKQLDQHFDPTLTLPVDAEHTYVVQPVDAETGAWVTAVMGLAIRVRTGDVAEPTAEDLEMIRMDTDAQKDMYRRVLGDVYDEMKSDGMNWEIVKLVGTTAVVWVHQGIDAAEDFWNNGGQPPKAQKKAPRDRRPSAKKTTTA